MKRLFLSFFIIILSVAAFAQTGLDGIVVEKYYLTNSTDAAADPLNLPANSVTYRIYVDLKADWKLQSIFAEGIYDKNQPMQFKTTGTRFYNSPSGNKSWGDQIDYASLASNGLLMLDSYLTWGVAAAPAGSNNYWGRLKADDDPANQLVVSGGLIQNTSAFTGIPVNQRDGYLTSATAPPPANVKLGIDPLLAMLDGTTPGNLWDSDETNGALIANLTNTGVSGADPDNKILIGQFTTDGAFTFMINLTIKHTGGTIEDLVASNPVDPNDFLVPALFQTLNPPALPTPPSVTNLTVTPGSVTVGGVVNLSVEAVDALPGSISKVEFFRTLTSGGTPLSMGISPSTSSPYLLTWPSEAPLGNFNITAVATDDEGTPATSSIVPLVITSVPLNQLPIVDVLTVPATVNVNGTINGSATAHDPDGSIQSVQFYVNNVPVGVPDPSIPYEFTYTAPASEQTLTIKAVATDNQGGLSADKLATVSVIDPAGGYKIDSYTVNCNSSDLFYIPVVTKTGYVVSQVIGYDLVMSFNSAKVKPTGLVRVNDDLVLNGYTSYAVNIIDVPLADVDSIKISLFLNATAPAGTFFAGAGDRNRQVLAVEFAKTLAFLPDEIVEFNVGNSVTGEELFESKFTGVSSKPVTGGTFTSESTKNFIGTLKFWADNQPIYYTGSEATSLITRITEINAAASTAVFPNMLGQFSYPIVNGDSIKIRRRIDDATSVWDLVNGYDAYLTQRVVIEDESFRPNVFQMIAMDVNQDGKISAGDVSQILQHSVGIYNQFRQVWNYTDAGNPNGKGASNDWTFVDNSTLNTNLAYRISSNYPKADAKGITRNRVPQPDHETKGSVFKIPVTYPRPGYNCPDVRTEEYQGIMLGDVNGNYMNLLQGEKPSLKKGSLADDKNYNEEKASSSSKVVFDLSNSGLSSDYFVFPVVISSDKDVNSLDFAMKFDQSKLRFKEVTVHSDGIDFAVNVSETDNTLRFASYSLKTYKMDAPVVLVKFEVLNNSLSQEDFTFEKAYLNGNSADIERTDLTLNELIDEIRIYPNPARDFVNIVLTDNGDINLLDMLGRTIRTYKDIKAYEKFEINVAGLPQGTYIMRIIMNIANEEFVATRKLVIKK